MSSAMVRMALFWSVESTPLGLLEVGKKGAKALKQSSNVGEELHAMDVESVIFLGG